MWDVVHRASAKRSWSILSAGMGLWLVVKQGPAEFSAERTGDHALQHDLAGMR
jgi:hypothetical protein